MAAPHSPAQLPSGFKYPPEYLTSLKGASDTALVPWEFEDSATDAGQLLLGIALRHTPPLVPFARLDAYGGDVDFACFDASDTTGDPAVIMLVLDGSDRAWSYANFEVWLERAKIDASDWSEGRSMRHIAQGEVVAE
jgi:hypothetical protein